MENRRVIVDLNDRGLEAVVVRSNGPPASSKHAIIAVISWLNVAFAPRRARTKLHISPHLIQYDDEILATTRDRIDNVGQDDHEQTFLMLEVGAASLTFGLAPTALEEVGQTLLALSARASTKPS